jgi:reactive intermediate/imine deaminase
MKIFAHTLLAVLSLGLVSALPAAESATERKVFKHPKAEAMGLPFSDAVLAGNTLYLSGNGGIDTDTMTVPEDPKDEARLLMENIRTTLAQADMSFDDLVSVTVYCSDLSLYADFNEVYRAYFSGDFPARAFIGSGPLLFGMRFEVQAIAVR